MCYFPDDSLIIAITSNGMTVNLNDVLIGVLSIYSGRSYTFPVFPKTTIELPPTEHFAGNYKAKLFGLFTVAKFQLTTASKNHLFMNEHFEQKDSEKALLERRDKYGFYMRNIGGEMIFWENRKGKVKGAKMKQGKFTIKCKKTK